MSSPVIVKAYLNEGKLSVTQRGVLHIIRPKSFLTSVIPIALFDTYASSKSIFSLTKLTNPIGTIHK